MSLKDKIKFIKKKSTKTLLGIKNINENSIECINGDIIIMFEVKASNILTLSKERVEQKIDDLATVIKSSRAYDSISIIAFDTSQNFKANKKYLNSRIEEETNPIIKNLLMKEIEFIESIKLKTVTAKEFVISIKFSHREGENIGTSISQFNKLMEENNFFISLLQKDDLKHILAVYFAQSTSEDTHSDIEGEVWI